MESLNIHILTIIISLFSLTLAAVTAIFSFKAYASVIGLQNSTHNVTYMPIDPKVDQQNEEFLDEKLREEKWATSDTTYAAQQKVFKEDMEEAGMEDFLQDDEDKKVHSF